ncbi:hypothetical protein HYZ05_01860 [Candidatus Daviesbacteria bacterium]|nr:hypothetical protein [Candidatus Daviesbacteria bacterium]
MKKVIILFFYILGVSLLFYYDFFTPPQQEQFVKLAASFLQGKLYFLSPTFDAAINSGHYYWPLGPFPAILLMPFVYIFGDHMRQGYLLFFLNILNAFLLFRIAKKLSGNFVNSLIVSFAVSFSTAYLGIALIPWSWYYAQTVGFTLTLLALEAYFFNRSYLLIGSYIALAFSTRVSLIFTAVFFILNLFYSESSMKLKFRKLSILIIPIIISIMVLGFYNYARFGNPWETGYSKQSLDGPVGAGRIFGLWNIKHIPTNLYSMFLKMPDPLFIPRTNIMQFPYLKADGSGISILFTSPIFFWILFSNWKDKKVKFAGITALIMMFALWGSFSNGSWQYGYRYAIDSYPFASIILIYSFKKDVSYKFLTIAIVAFLINLYFINTIFYPSIMPILDYFK